MIPVYTNNSVCLCPTTIYYGEPGEYSEILDDSVGLNWAMPTYDLPWNGTIWLDLLAYITPGTMRYPGGNVSQEWSGDNQILYPQLSSHDPTGWVDPDRLRGDESVIRNDLQRPNTIANLYIAWLQTPHTPVWCLNLTTPGWDFYSEINPGWTDPTPGSTDPSDSWNLMLADRYDRALRMLQEAEGLGMPITYIELGNEFYLPGRDYISGDNDFIGAFPDDGRTYPMIANQWAEDLKIAFPGVRVAATGAVQRDGIARSPRRATWNTMLINGIDSSEPLDSDFIDAVAIHNYVSFKLYSFKDKSTFWTNIGIFNINLNASFNTSSLLTDAGYPLWITEFAPRPLNTYAFQWGNALMTVLHHFFYLQRSELVEQILFHQFQRLITHDTDRNVQTAAIKCLDNAAKGMNSCATIEFTTPVIPGTTTNVVQGMVFTDGTSKRAVLVNLNDVTYNIGLRNTFNFPSLDVLMFSHDAVSDSGFPDENSVTMRGNELLVLLPYSITLISSS